VIVNATGGGVVPGSVQQAVNERSAGEHRRPGGYGIPCVAEQVHFRHTLQFDGALARR
jgi:hypothetical protein